MPKFAANLTMMYQELEFLDRFEAAAKAGFKGVEFLFPYPFEKQELADRLRANSLAQVLHNLPAGDWAAGERGLTCLPGRTDEFQDSVGAAIDYATALGCSQLNSLVGICPDGTDRELAQKTLIDNLTFAAKLTKQANIKLLIEPVNSQDIPGYLVDTSAKGLAIMDAVGSDNLFLQYDIYHMQRMEGELANTIAANLDRIPHMQLADNPGRHEPGTGEINYDYLFKFIDSLDYQGWIGCEYIPTGGTDAGLSWYAPHKN